MKNKLILLTIAFLLVIPLAQSITQEQALQAIQNAEQDIEQMKQAGFSTQAANDTLTQAYQALQRVNFAQALNNNLTGEIAEQAKKALAGLDYQGFNYDEVIKYTDEITNIKNRALELTDTIKASEIEIQNQKTQAQNLTGLKKITGHFISEDMSDLIDTQESEALLQQAQEALNQERYQEADQLILQAQQILEDKKAEVTTTSLLSRAGKSFFIKNWPLLLIFTIVLITGGWFTNQKIKVKKNKNKLEKLLAEKKAIIKLMKKAQKERFETSTLPQSVYNIRMEKYNERLNHVKRNIPVVRNILKK